MLRAKIKLENKNEVLNSYTFAIVGGLSVVFTNLQLTKVSENETKIFLNAQLRQGNTIAQNELIDKFFSVFSSVLSGENKDIELPSSGTNNNGCLIFIIFGVGFILCKIFV